MGVLETVSRIVELGGRAERAHRVAALRATFEARAGAFTPDDAWFEARSRAFWCDAVTRARFGREVEGELDEASRPWLAPLERAHRGLFRAEGRRLIDVWSGAEVLVDEVDEESRAELDAAAGQFFDARVVAAASPFSTALLPGALFHPPDANAPIGVVLDAARARDLPTDAVLDALLRMERRLRSLSRVKSAYAYRVEALDAPVSPASPLRRAAKAPAR